MSTIVPLNAATRDKPPSPMTDARRRYTLDMRRRAAECRRLASQCRKAEVAKVLLELAEEFDRAGACDPSHCPIRCPAKRQA
jgi:hypothetical protein